MHHSHTHTNHNNPSQTNHHQTTQRQQSTKGQKHRHTANQHNRHHHNTRNKTHTERSTPKILHYTTIRTNREHKQGGELITLIKDDITFTNINIPNAINTHNTELQLIKIHIGKTKHITVANTYFPPRDTASPHYNTVDTNIAYCI